MHGSGSDDDTLIRILQGCLRAIGYTGRFRGPLGKTSEPFSSYTPVCLHKYIGIVFFQISLLTPHRAQKYQWEGSSRSECNVSRSSSTLEAVFELRGIAQGGNNDVITLVRLSQGPSSNMITLLATWFEPMTFRTHSQTPNQKRKR